MCAALNIIDSIGDKALGGGRVGVKSRHRDTIVNGRIDGVGQFIGVGAGDGNAFRASEDELLNGFSLFLGVLFVGRAPVDLDVKIEFSAQLFRRILGADAGGLEDGVALRFSDEANRDGARRGGGEDGAGEAGGEDG